jgi:DHA1 family bicyclomycin/chloramphenicol resistance-like MFS transporter
MLRPDTFALTALLALLTAIGPVSVDMYLASLPDIGRMLVTSPAAVQLTLSVYLTGYTIGQIVYGPLSDRHGRRPVMLVALIVYCAASVACAAAPTIATLLIARTIQAIGVSGAVVLARAIVRDLYEGPRAARELSLMASIMALAPVGAPPVGGVLQSLFGWRSNFVFMTAVGLIAAAAVWRGLPETIKVRNPGSISLRVLITDYRDIASNRVFASYLGMLAFTFGGLFTWISGLPFVLQDLYGLSPFWFGIAFSAGALGYMTGTSLAARIVDRIGIDLTIGWGVAAMLAGGFLAVATVALDVASAVPLILAMAFYVCGLGLVQPQSTAGAMMPFPDRAGAASSLIGAVQMTFAAIAGIAVGHALDSTAWPLVLPVAGMSCVTFALWALTRRIRTNAGKP